MRYDIKKKTAGILLALSVSTSILAAGCGAAGSKSAANKAETKPAVSQAEQTKQKEAKLSSARNTPIVQAAKKVGPAVVGITNKALVRDYFNRTQLVEQGSGSGVIYSKDGLIATNNHVVAGAQEIVVSLSDGKTYNGKVLGTDPTTDLAVVKIEANEDLPVAEFGDSDSLMVGEPAIAIGNPLGMEFRGSVTAGVISALNRSLDMGERRFKLIQTDAAINPGTPAVPWSMQMVRSSASTVPRLLPPGWKASALPSPSMKRNPSCRNWPTKAGWSVRIWG